MDRQTYDQLDRIEKNKLTLNNNLLVLCKKLAPDLFPKIENTEENKDV
jgi:hypothetical protein